MAKQRDKLTDKEVKNATISGRLRKLSDGRACSYGSCQPERSTGDWSPATSVVVSFSLWEHTLM